MLLVEKLVFKDNNHKRILNTLISSINRLQIKTNDMGMTEIHCLRRINNNLIIINDN